EHLTLDSGSSIQQRTTTLRAVQTRVQERALGALSKVQPSKAEAHLPGLSIVERDLTQVPKKELDSSWLTNMVRLTVTPSMISKLVKSKEVAFVVRNFDVRLPQPVEITETEVKAAQEKQEEAKYTWGLEYLKIPELWEKKLTGDGVLIGHLDTGVDASHPDL